MSGMRVSVSPPGGSGETPGELILEWHEAPDGYVKVLRADRVIYISEELYGLVRDGWSPFAQIVRENPRDRGILKIRGLDGLVAYEITGYLGPPGWAYLCEMPD
jgi:hypothetical protein